MTHMEKPMKIVCVQVWTYYMRIVEVKMAFLKWQLLAVCVNGMMDLFPPIVHIAFIPNLR